MSKRSKILIAVGTPLLLTIALVVIGISLGWFEGRDPVFTDEIPKERPIRLDHRLLERFSDQPVAEILEILKTEAAPETSAGDAIPATKDPVPALLAMLPDAPLPFPGSAAPQDAEGIKNFVTGMQQEKNGEPSGEERRQFNLALAALHVSPEKVPEAIRIDVHPTPESSVFPVRLSSRESDISGPFTAVDLDGDGAIEIVAAGGSRLFQVNDRGMLDAVDSLNGIVPGNGVVAADFDRDGDSDLFITRGSNLPNSLLRNEGNGSFVDVTIETGLLSFNDTVCAAWLDYDSDGLLDLLVGSNDHPLELYHQTAGKIFQPVAWDLGLWIPRGVHGIQTTDLNGDGFPDFFAGVNGGKDRLFLSQPSANWNDWRFQDIAVENGIDSALDRVTAAFSDINNDGQPDLLLGAREALPITPEDQKGIPKWETLPPPPPAATSSTLRLFENRGEGKLIDVTGEAGLVLDDPVFAIGIADLDNDSFEDLIVGTAALAINRTFSNRGGTGFQEISVVSGGSYLDRPELYATADLDGNGSADLLYLNQAGQVRWLESVGAIDRWISLRAPGHPPGMHVALQLRDRDWILRSVERTMGLDSSILIGIGQAEIIERIDFFSPGEKEPLKTLEKVEPNRRLTVELPKLPGKRAVVPLEEEKKSTANR